jgi:very-short-patch-repair endonuclease
MRQCARALRKEMTSAEKALWQVIREGRLNGLCFRKQHAHETFVFDFYCPATRLIVEVDGDVHSVPDVAEHDRCRDEYLSARGFRILRVLNEEVFGNLPVVLSRIESAVKSPSPHSMGGEEIITDARRQEQGEDNSTTPIPDFPPPPIGWGEGGSLGLG